MHLYADSLNYKNSLKELLYLVVDFTLFHSWFSISTHLFQQPLLHSLFDFRIICLLNPELFKVVKHSR